MPCTIHLRHDQFSTLIEAAQRDGVEIFAAHWVRDALQILGEKLRGVSFQIIGANGAVMKTFTLTADISLQQLQMITRLEPRNVTGKINFLCYSDIPDKSIVFALRDLVRQCVIVGLDTATHFGGYGCARERQPSKVPVYICDLSALQFQKVYNTGRLVLIPKKQEGFPVGLLDNLIFENVVGQPKPSFKTARKDTTGRFVRESNFFSHCVYFDTFAYKRFIRQDVILTGIALNTVAAKSKDNNGVHFKFLKYGCGFFAGEFTPILDANVLSGVLDGLEALFEKLGPTSLIKSVELPFYSCEDKINSARIKALQNEFGVPVSFGTDDALKVDPNWAKNKIVLATTNCADPHAPTGNEMEFGSMDAAIAENLESKGDIFCPCLNQRIQGQFLELN